MHMTRDQPSVPRRSRHRLSRTLLVLVPLHLIAFGILYLGLVWLVQREIIAVHGGTARIFAREMVDDLHPVMETSEPTRIRQGLSEFSELHDLLRLQLFDARGRPIAGGDTPENTIVTFLGHGQPASFDLIAANDGWAMRGLVSIVSGPQCDRCHMPGQVLGAASMTYDVSVQVSAAHGRIRRGIAVLGLAWAMLVGLSGLASRRLVTRSVERLRAEVGRASGATATDLSPPSKLLFDPLSAELYTTLLETLQRQRRREEQVVSRLHHTDRLASLGQVAAGLAHEIKNPIAGLHGALEILRDETGDEHQRELFEQMLSETRRVNETIQSLLRLARPARPRPRPTEVATLLRETVRLLEPGYRKRGVHISCATAPDLKPFQLDTGQMRQVLVNLVTNAAEAMTDGGTVQLRAAAWPEGDGLILSVEDDGPGIDAEIQRQIFEPFFTTKHTGTGLGLAVARTLVAQHGGSIEVSSTPGAGTTFLVLVPTATSHVAAAGTDPS